jgi:chromosome segregation ATPase
MSAARQRLAEMIEARDEIAAKIESLQAALTRLASQQAAEGPLVGELAALDSAEAAKMNEWARSGEGDAPLPDVAKREALNRKLADARAAAEAARRAESGLQAEVARESAKLPSIARAMDLAVADILFEEAEPLIADFLEANRAVAAKASRIEVLRDVVIGMAHAAGDLEQGRPFFTALEAFDGRLQKVSGRQPPDLDVSSRHRLDWFGLVEQLRSDSNATLGA